MNQRDTYAFCDHLSLGKLEASLRDHAHQPEKPFEELEPIGTKAHQVGVALTSKKLLQRLAQSEFTLGKISSKVHPISHTIYPFARLTDDSEEETIIIPKETQMVQAPNFTGTIIQANAYNGGNMISRFIHAYEEAHPHSIPIFYASPRDAKTLRLLIQ